MTVSKMQAAVQQAQEMFDELDADHNGQLDIKELATLAKKLNQRWAKKDLLQYFNRMVELEALYGRGKDHADGPADHADTTVVSKDTFVQWWMSYQRDLRRKLLTETMNMWDDHQKRSFKWDDAGEGLQKRSFNVVVGKATGLPNYKCFPVGKLNPPFDSSSTFFLVPRANPDVILREEFEEWWGDQIGYDGSEIPILPEYMARKIEAAATTR